MSVDRSEYLKEYYRLHKERIKERDQLFNELHPTALAERHKRYITKYPDKVKEARRKYSMEHSIDINLKSSTWAKNNRDKVRINAKRYADKNPDKSAAKEGKRRPSKLNRTPHWLSKEELNKIKEVYKTAKQLTKETGIVHHVDHIIPLQGRQVSGLHILCNLQVITAKDNLVKFNKFIIN